MRVLLDTGVLLWWLAGDEKLSKTAKGVLSQNETKALVSAASAWEICTKLRIGKLPTAADLCANFATYMPQFHFEALPVAIAHGQLAGRMPGDHRDPFDRMLAAQAIIERVPIITNVAAIAAFGPQVIW